MPLQKYGAKAETAEKSWQRKYYRLWRQKKAIIIRFTVMSYQLQRRSRQSAKRFTEQRVLYMNLLQRNSLHELNQWALASSRYVWQRTIHIREVYVNAGAGFVVALTGAIMTMPGLPKVPAANGIDVEDGKITGLF